MRNDKLSAKDIRKLVKENHALLGVKFEINEFTSDVNKLVRKGIEVECALQIVGLKTMIDYAAHWQDSFSLYEIEVDENNPSSWRIKEWTEDIISTCTSQLENISFEFTDIFTEQEDDDEEKQEQAVAAVGGAN